MATPQMDADNGKPLDELVEEVARRGEAFDHGAVVADPHGRPRWLLLRLDADTPEARSGASERAPQLREARTRGRARRASKARAADMDELAASVDRIAESFRPVREPAQPADAVSRGGRRAEKAARDILDMTEFLDESSMKRIGDFVRSVVEGRMQEDAETPQVRYATGRDFYERFARRGPPLDFTTKAQARTGSQPRPSLAEALAARPDPIGSSTLTDR